MVLFFTKYKYQKYKLKGGATHHDKLVYTAGQVVKNKLTHDCLQIQLS